MKAASHLIVLQSLVLLNSFITTNIHIVGANPATGSYSRNSTELTLAVGQAQLLDAVSCSIPQECGKVKNITFPFRINSDSRCKVPNDHFKLTCESDKLYVLRNSEYGLGYSEIKEIWNDSLIVNNSNLTVSYMVNIGNAINRNCSGLYADSWVVLPPVGEGPFVVSKENKLGSFGCSSSVLTTVGISQHPDGDLYAFEGDDTGGCSIVDPEINKTCVYSFPASSSVTGIRYAKISVDQGTFISNSTFYDTTICPKNCSDNNASLYYDKIDQLKLTWAIPLPINYTPFNESFIRNRSSSSNDSVSLSPPDPLEHAIRSNLTDFACSSENGTQIVFVPSVWGYRCSCKAGYKGDGYINGTKCSDIHECDDPYTNLCTKNSKCNDRDGGYTCKCKSIFHIGDGKLNGSGCKFPKIALIIIIAVPTSIFFILLFPCLLLKWWKRKLREKNFVQNGGLQLQEYIQRSGRDVMRLFTHDELKQATENFSASMKIGVGGFGVVYKGILANGREVAIKMATKQVETENEEFINEIAILSQINHRHIVKLLGCCLETTCPLLVYEYVSNGNLADNLESRGGVVMSWDQRLKIAKQTSEALTYLHSIASPPILHRDVKSTNVLLDHIWEAKVADFGVSRLLPEGTEHVSTAIKGTLGYLDPEYFQTLQLTEKSDVYSFGVLLVELITSLKPVDTRNRSEGFSNLALLFIHHMKQGTIQELIDNRLLPTTDDESNEISWKVQSSILSVATLARQCLSLVGIDRPSMNVVANELNSIYNTLVFVDMLDESSIPLLHCHNTSDGGAVIVENSKYFIQSDISESISITSPMVNMSTMLR